MLYANVKDLLMNGMRGYRGKNPSSSERRTGDLPENIGNRRTFEETRIPPDNVGNIVEHDPITTFIHDGLGNSTDDEPSHLKSGILRHLVPNRERTFVKRHPQTASRDYQNNDRPMVRAPSAAPANAFQRREVKQARSPEIKRTENVRNAPIKEIPADGQDYMARLTKEFSKLLSEKAGLPFSFSMRPIIDHAIDDETEQKNLESIKTLITEILRATSIAATVSISRYRTPQHRFAVFFLNPKERDPARNKDLISALRQVVKLHSSRFPHEQINILLVLANAQSVIETHLDKLGAKRVD